MRVALCVSGQMRTVSKTIDSLFENLIELYDTTVFVSTWDSNSHQGISNNLTHFDWLSSVFKTENIKLHEYTSEISERFEGVRVPDELKRVKPQSYKSNIPMYFLMQDCDEQRIQYETDHSIKFDWVIRTRPDILIFRPLRLNKYSNHVLNLKHIIDDTYYCDQFAFGSSENMTYYSSIFKRLDKYWEQPLGNGNFNEIRSGETLMRHHLLLSDIELSPMKFRYPIIRESDGKFDIVKKKYWNNFKYRIKSLWI